MPLLRLVALVVACAFAANVVRADAPAPVATQTPATAGVESITLMTLEADIEVDAAGGLTKLELTTPAPANIRANMGGLVQGWRFAPVRGDDGKPMAASAHMTLVLVARPVGDSFEVRVDSVRFRDRGAVLTHDTPTARIHADGLRRPHYPDSVREPMSAVVLLAVLLDVEGGVDRVEVVQSAVFEPQQAPESVASALKRFEDNAMRAARTWQLRVEPTGAAAPTREDLTVLVPVRYYTGKHELTQEKGAWRRVARTPRRSIPWKPEDPVGVANAGDAPSSSRSALKLVAGDPGG
jgi:hypothetical protein